MNRRSFLKGLVGVSAAVILPPEPEKRFWSLDQTMIPDDKSRMFKGFMDAMDVRNTPLISRLPDWDEQLRIAYLKDQFDLDRAILHGEYDSPMGEFIRSRNAKLWDLR